MCWWMVSYQSTQSGALTIITELTQLEKQVSETGFSGEATYMELANGSVNKTDSIYGLSHSVTSLEGWVWSVGVAIMWVWLPFP